MFIHLKTSHQASPISVLALKLLSVGIDYSIELLTLLILAILMIRVVAKLSNHPQYILISLFSTN